MNQCIVSILGIGLFSLSQIVWADMFGYFDPRSMSMGGTGIAAASSANAALYNPALLATYDRIKEKADNSRFVFPIFSLRVTSLVTDINSFKDQNFDNQLNNAVNAYNALPIDTNAQGVIDIAGDLQNRINTFADDNHIFDVHVGVVIAIPGKREGGSFYLMRRAYGRAGARISAADRQALDDYIQGLRFIASNGEQGEIRPQLFDGQGQLIDRSDNFTSTASARGLDLIEAGIPFAGEFKLFGQEFYFGATPKFQIITAYDFEQNNLVNANTNETKSDKKLKVNMDFGFAKDFKEKFRVGFTLSNLIPRDIKTNLNNKIRIRPEIRSGIYYQYNNRIAMAADLDILTNNVFNVGNRSQNLAFGVNWSVNSVFHLRSGYRHDLNNFSNFGPLSLGFGLSTRRIMFDFALAWGSLELGTALQFGIQF